MIKPRQLQPDSRVAIVSPSNGLPFRFPGIFDLGLKNLREILGLEVVEFPTARMDPAELYRHPELRAADLNRAFADASIDGIISSIGGYESVRILRHLDVATILSNPKLIMGFSDSTTFLSYLNYRGMVTFYGPSVMAGFAQLHNFPVQCTEHIRDILFAPSLPYAYSPYPEYTSDYQDWSNLDTLGECAEFHPNAAGWQFLPGSQAGEGRLWGGCIEALEFLKGTEYWPDKSFWADKILCFETSEEKPLPMNVGYMLRNYGIQGILNQVRGIIFGRPKDYSDREKQELSTIVQQIVRDEFQAMDIPVVMNVDFGHTDPKLILPLGCRASLDPVSGAFRLTESPFCA